jgi:multiple sugar transport system permease protein
VQKMRGWMYDSLYSVVNWMLKAAGLIDTDLMWLGEPMLAMIAVVLVHVWRTLPLLMPIMCVTLLFGTIFTFSDMTVIYILTRGGPYDTTQVLGSLAFFTGILGGDLGGGAAISLFLFPVLAVVAIVMLRIARRMEVD